MNIQIPRLNNLLFLPILLFLLPFSFSISITQIRIILKRNPPMRAPKRSKKLRFSRNTPINTPHNPADLDARKEPVHAELESFFVAWYGPMDVCETETQFLAGVEARGEAGCVGLEDVFWFRYTFFLILRRVWF